MELGNLEISLGMVDKQDENKKVKLEIKKEGTKVATKYVDNVNFDQNVDFNLSLDYKLTGEETKAAETIIGQIPDIEKYLSEHPALADFFKTGKGYKKLDPVEKVVAKYMNEKTAEATGEESEA